VPEKVDELRQYDSTLSEFANAKATDVSINVNYKPGVRILTIIAMPNYSVLLDAVYHSNGSRVTHHKHVFACSKAVDAIANIYICAITKQPDSFPRMHCDISCSNIMAGLPGEADNAACLINFDFTTFCDNNKKISSSVAPHRTGTRVSMSLALLMADGRSFSPLPHHRPYFNMESIFWSIYVAVLLGIAGPDDENIFQSQINQFCLEDQGQAKYAVLQKSWLESLQAVECCGRKMFKPYGTCLQK
jgi:hypothetical protein